MKMEDFLVIHFPVVCLAFGVAWTIFALCKLPCSFRSAVCAQYALSAAYMQLIIVSRLLAAMRLVEGELLLRHCRAFSIAYYLFDTLYILAAEFREQKMFILHHVIAMAMGYMTGGVLDAVVMSDYMFYIELSNVWLTPWDFCKRHRHVDSIRDLYESLTPVVAFSYVPFRVLHLTVNSARLLAALRSVPRSPASATAIACIAAVLLLSYHFAVRVASIYMHKRAGAGGRLGVHATLSGQKWWPVVTFIAKWYVTLHMLVHVLPPTAAPVLALDLTSIVVSWLYYHSDFSSFSEMLDHLFIHGKVVALGTALYLAGATATTTPWLCSVVLNVAWFAHCVVFGCPAKVPAMNRSNWSFAAYGIPYVTMIVPAHYYDNSAVIIASTVLCTAGMLVWILRVPERWMQSTAYNSLGWMHLAVLLSDACLMVHISACSAMNVPIF